MEDFTNTADDDIVQSVTGSPSDALIGLDQSDPAVNEDILEEATIDTFDGAFPTDAATKGHLPQGATIQVSDDFDPEEPLPSIDTYEEVAPVATMSEPVVGLDTASTNMEAAEGVPEEVTHDRVRPVRIEIVLRRLSPEECAQYRTIKSDVVDEVIGEVEGPESELWYNVEFTDGRQDIIPFGDLLAYDGGESALQKMQGDVDSEVETGAFHGQKRSWEDTLEDSEADSQAELDLMELDEEELPRQSKRQRSVVQRSARLTSIIDSDDEDEDEVSSRRSRRQRTTTRQSTRQNSHAAVSDDEDESRRTRSRRHESSQPQRQLRERTQKQLTLTSMAFGNPSLTRDDDMDELSQDPPQQSDGEDDDFTFITSDLQPKPGRGRRKQPRRLKSSKAKPEAKPRSRDSSIEFEDRRRSGRSTRNKASMLDSAPMDEESFYIEDTAPVGAPRVMNVKEVFKQLPHDSPFLTFHSDICSSCNVGPAANKGPLISCQGCSMSFHKVCLGYRSAREHLVTKVGAEDFVLQCKYCIGFYGKKDKHAPRHHNCQGCEKPGRSCAAFSPRRTPKQEEKLRIENGGEDPIAPVDPALVNNVENVLFRCTSCKRGWHYEHLPSSQMDTDLSNVRDQRLSEYSVDWKCHDCAMVSHKIQTLVAWRLTKKDSFSDGMTYSDFYEDEKDYLIKWADCSYFHCTWMPGAWVFHMAPGAMRNSFAKRDAEQNLCLRWTTDEAIPEEYLLTDVILAAKVKNGRSRSLQDDMERIGSVDKIYVKFQGLGYDEAVWDKPPKPDTGEIYNTFKAAYYEYLTGKYFVSPTNHKMKQRVNDWKEEKFVALTEQPKAIRRGNLMAYQLEGVNWLLYNYHEDKNVILADEMGLGKTVQVVSLISALALGEPKCWPFLVVVPNATCPNWRREIKQWAPELRVVTYHGGKQPQELAYKYELFPNGSSDIKAHVVVMSYDSAQDDRTRNLFRSVQWAGLIVDEGQRLKNDKSLLYLALRAMRFPFRLLLTGTPLQNNKRELFNLLQFIDPTQNAEKLDEQYQELNAQNLPELHGRIKQYFLRRTKAQVLKFLPPMAQIIVPVSMSILQEKLCKSIMAKSPDLIKAIFADDKINKKERGSLNNILMQLRKCLCHPFMYSDAIEERAVDHVKMHENLVSASGKLMLLSIMLPKLKERGHRVLIFSQFLDQLDIVEDFLNGLGFLHRRLDGKINSHEKQKHIDAFNAPDSEVFAFLLSTRAGGVGINLATADTVIILDPDFNPHQDIQAISRAHRIGQKHKVLCFQLMTKNSAEEKIMQIGRKKMALDHVLIEAMDDTGEPDDLESILKFGATALFSDDQNEKDIIRYDEASVEKLLDRSHIEQTSTGQDESAESTFSFARVWANDKGGFEDNLAEENEPTVNPNVWEEILAEREAEAKRLAELNKEVLGRGGRRRQAVNYKTNAPIATDLAVDHSGSSDNDEDFVGGEDEEPDTDPEDRNTMSKASITNGISGVRICGMETSTSLQARDHRYPGEMPPASFRRYQPQHHHQQQAPMRHMLANAAPTPRSIDAPNWRMGMNMTTATAQVHGHYHTPSLTSGPEYMAMGAPTTEHQPATDQGQDVGVDTSGFYAYCLDRGNGNYTRLVPADTLPPLVGIPAVQHGAEGMLVLPSPRGLDHQNPSGGTIQPVAFKKRIDHIVASSPAPPKKPKIYCDKWVHEGVCAFTQQGCKYKHEMPLDKATQHSLGLFHGLPTWWKKQQAELQRQQQQQQQQEASGTETFYDARQPQQGALPSPIRSEKDPSSPARASQSWRRVEGVRPQGHMRSSSPTRQNESGYRTTAGKFPPAPAHEPKLTFEAEQRTAYPQGMISPASPCVWGPIGPPSKRTADHPHRYHQSLGGFGMPNNFSMLNDMGERDNGSRY
ncbi:Chromatin remodeling factor mit1 [Colletotrichum sp. SAR 10_65]|nr:Chromatin remodeling factor mit1 [Colletotrichum sp. SAR 10_65]KAI8203673.1 Chromatin remodeling factor mit1 [Colletotrichum sp. SAR 10_76]KAJ4998248.1 Chromatin remodeling factor mit1 [Colletotrichum sp. SAR 10_66]